MKKAIKFAWVLALKVTYAVTVVLLVACVLYTAYNINIAQAVPH